LGYEKALKDTHDLIILAFNVLKNLWFQIICRDIRQRVGRDANKWCLGKGQVSISTWLEMSETIILQQTFWMHGAMGKQWSTASYKKRIQEAHDACDIHFSECDNGLSKCY